MNIIAFAGSNSRHSIKKKLATYTAHLIENAQVEVLDLNDYQSELFSVDREKEIGQSTQAKAFLAKLAAADAIVLSLAENNGNYSAAFKNLFDWCSRIEKEVFQNKPMLLLATSPGARGGKSVLEIAEKNLLRYGADIKFVFSLPSFYQNFDETALKISEPELQAQLQEIVRQFQKML